MLNRLRHLGRDERGMSFIFVGLSFMAFVAATTLAIDLGMVMTARDAGAERSRCRRARRCRCPRVRQLR